ACASSWPGTGCARSLASPLAFPLDSPRMARGDGSSDEARPRRARRKDSPTPSPGTDLVAQPSALPDVPTPVRAYDPERRVVAVTGARSFIGSETLKRLEEDRRYHKLIAFDLRKPDFPLDKTQF